jgi:hypothetical protein
MSFLWFATLLILIFNYSSKTYVLDALKLREDNINYQINKFYKLNDISERIERLINA